jgi:isopentenyl diphosphate isomerase/L-lactate dehydrogenase-like FMN-dependent dehydrogenase
MWGLAAGGAEGVERVLRGLDAELTLALTQSGATSLAALPTELDVSLG